MKNSVGKPGPGQPTTGKLNKLVYSAGIILVILMLAGCKGPSTEALQAVDYAPYPTTIGTYQRLKQKAWIHCWSLTCITMRAN